MRIHGPQTIEKLKKLRRQGYSIHALMKELELPKTTVWHHIRGIKLSQKQKKALRSNQGGSKLRSEKEWRAARDEARSLLNSPDKHLYIAIACLYWAEGSKRRCDFVNTDGDMIRMYLKILREHFKISEDSIEPTLRIFSNHDQVACLKYWSQATGIPAYKFSVLLNDGGARGRGFGMCRIVVRKGGYTLKVLQAIIQEICL